MTSIISIIVPVYNSQKYLTRCIDSILNQTFTNFECILINDGSTDASSEICDNYALQDNRIKVIHQKNSGVSVARNIGLNIASGEWIGFVDSDDWIEKDTYDTALQYAREKEAEVVEWGVYRSDDNRNYQVFDHPEGLIKLNKLNPVLWHGPCNKLIRRKLIKDNNISFPAGISLAEDMNFSIKVFYFSIKSYGIPRVLYHYYNNDNSAVNTINYKKIASEVNSINNINSFFKMNNADQIWYDLLMLKKVRVKSRYLFNLEHPDFNAWRTTFPEATKKTIQDSNILKKVFFLSIHYKFDFFALIIFRLRFLISAT